MDNKSYKKEFFESIKNGKIKEVHFFGERVNDLDFTGSEVMDVLKIACEQEYSEIIKCVLILIVKDGAKEGKIEFEKLESITTIIENAGAKMIAIASREIFKKYSTNKTFLQKGKSLNKEGGLFVPKKYKELAETMVKELESI